MPSPKPSTSLFVLWGSTFSVQHEWSGFTEVGSREGQVGRRVPRELDASFRLTYRGPADTPARLLTVLGGGRRG